MTKKLWQSSDNLNALVEQYTSGDDIVLDQNLVAVDIYGSLAHAKMLGKQRLISVTDVEQIQTGLLHLLQAYEEGNLILQPGDEDVHTRIEDELTQKYADAGAKLHTGRSRNDQVLVDIRLYSKQQLLKIAIEVIDLVTVFSERAKELQHIPMPGMTHMQPAMLSSFGLWLESFAESLLDDLISLESAFVLNNQSPLGSGAAYGVTLPIDRELTAKLLGFESVQNNPLYCQNSRGKIEMAVVHALVQVMATLNKFATDCLLFTTEPFSFITFEKSLGTGSSIMPQKQNWDALELMRAKYHQLVATQLQLSTSLANLPSGYNRDMQQTKGALMHSIQTVLASLQIAQLFVETLQVSTDQVRHHLPKEIFAAHWAYTLVQKDGVPFRKAYMYVKEHLNEIPDFDSSGLLQEAVSQGSTGNLQLEKTSKLAQSKEQFWRKKQTQFAAVITKLLKK